jgi:hypothetical protein
MHWCPGCQGPHGIRIEGPSPIWSFDGNYEKPTFAPSILVYTLEEDGSRHTECHYFIRSGMIEFCGDSPHALAGKTVEIPEWPYAPGDYGGIDDD